MQTQFRVFDPLFEAALLVLLVLDPLLINIDNTDAYRTVQATFAASLITVATGLWAMGLCLGRRWRAVARLPMVLPLSLFLVWCLLSVAPSTAPFTSFRTWLHLFLYALLFLAVADLSARRPGSRGRLVVALLIPFVVNASAGILQYWRFDFSRFGLGIDASFWSRSYLASLDAPARIGEVAGFLGNPNVLGNYLAVSLPIALVFAIGHAPRWRVIPYGVAALLGFVATICSLTRGAWVGLILSGIFLAWFGGTCGSRYFRRFSKWRPAVLAVFVVVAGVLSLWWAKSENLVAWRVASRFEGTGKSAATIQQRFVVWSVAGLMADDSPVLGQGIGSFESHYCRFLARKFEGLEIPEFMEWRFTHAHNEFVQLAAETGYVGLLLGLGTAVAFFFGALRLLRRTRLAHREKRLALSGTAGLLAMTVAAVFSFPFRVAASGLAFVTVAGIVAGLCHSFRSSGPPRKSSSPSETDRSLGSHAPLVAITCVVLTLVVLLSRSYEADKLTKEGMDLYSQGRLAETEDRLREAIQLDAERGDARMVLGVLYKAQKKFPESIRMFEEALRSFDDAPLHYHLAEAYRAQGDLSAARTHYLRTKAYLPRKAKLYPVAVERLQELERSSTGAPETAADERD